MMDEFIGKTLADKYQIEELLRESDLGNIYRGRHLLMENSVTIKILAPALAVDNNIVERFSVEARTISRLSHPNILNVTDFGRDEDGTVFIVMEDAEGESLKDAIQNEGAFPVGRAIRIARQIAAALSSAHSNLIVHRHLTSDKILLAKMANGTEIVKVLDIGSFNADENVDHSKFDSLGDIAYLSPEQCSGEVEADERSDIYSLGVIFYEMLAGELPFVGENATDLMLKHAEVPPPPLVAFRNDIPDDIEPIVIRALAKNPDMRYQTAAAFAEDIGRTSRIDGDENTIVIPRVDNAASDGNSNNIWKTAFILLAGISLLAFGLIYWTKAKQTDPTTVQAVDENGLPVQPLNPATGLNEQNLPNPSDYPSNSIDPNDPLVQGDIPPGGDGYDPWARPGTPPGGSPTYGEPYGQGGDMVTIPGRSDSPFTQDDFLGYDANGNPIYQIRVPKKSPSPTPGPKTSPTPDGTGNDPSPTPKPQDDGAKKPESKPTEKPAAKDGNNPPKPAAKPKPSSETPASNSQKPRSGVEQDT
ncbi:MAG: serine/threonine protein kinase [Acidobacteria bacterium]|nr:serine/threonine protein kinase [Acidobacteriota bacterium]